MSFEEHMIHIGIHSPTDMKNISGASEFRPILEYTGFADFNTTIGFPPLALVFELEDISLNTDSPLIVSETTCSTFRWGAHSGFEPSLNDSDILHEAEVNSSDRDFEDTSSMVPQRFDQLELNDLISDLDLSKESSEVLASRLNDKNLLHPGTKITYYRNREQSLLPYFSNDNSLVWCNDVGGLLGEMGVQEYRPNEWRLLIDSSTRSLKCVLLHNGNKYASIPIGHSTSMKEVYESIKLVLEKLKYHVHQWVICVDLKMVNFLLGQQSGYTNTHASFVFGIAEQEMTTGEEKIGP
ncbi:hypothetical protein LOD99_5029 [Oopsacas minuta]|uniref:Uncharacterized protein n=1 Tax=Oopsacas minuta TaxID=111878 RepID=A0AAV7JS26_9METZ|nr:hypothetical protein LOD99_5029 [Oopsacas minuta]